MEKTKKLLTAIASIIILGFFIWAMIPKSDYTDRVKDKISKESEKADVVFKDATLAEIYDGIKYWELVANSSIVNKSTGVADMADVKGLFFDKGSPTIKFIAPSSKWYIDKNEMYLTDSIGYDIKYEKTIAQELSRVKDASHIYSIFHLAGNKEGYWFQAKNLNWRLSTKKLICTSGISLTKGDVTINAEKLEADVGLEKVLLTGHPSAKLLQGTDAISISADRFIVDSSSDTIISENNVVISHEPSRITSKRSVYRQKDGSFELSGDVYLSDEKIEAYARSAIYDILNKKVILMDKARATRDGNELNGDKITVLLGLNRIIIEGQTKARIQKMEVK